MERREVTGTETLVREGSPRNVVVGGAPGVGTEPSRAHRGIDGKAVQLPPSHGQRMASLKRILTAQTGSHFGMGPLSLFRRIIMANVRLPVQHMAWRDARSSRRREGGGRPVPVLAGRSYLKSCRECDLRGVPGANQRGGQKCRWRRSASSYHVRQASGRVAIDAARSHGLCQRYRPGPAVASRTRPAIVLQSGCGGHGLASLSPHTA